MMKATNNVFLLVISVVGVFFLGWYLSSRKKEMEKKAGEIAMKEGLDYVKSQADITKDWWKQLTNTIKNVWK